MHRLFALVLVAACGGDAAQSVDPSPDVGPVSRCVAAPSAPDDPHVAVTEAGEVRGVAEGATVAFLGMPYAAPPVGDLRFRAPEPAACWEGVRAADSYGSSCLQLVPAGGSFGAEDCLFANVWTPATSGSRPVMVFIHGGALEFGGGNQQVSLDAGGGNLYDGSALAAAHDAVVVTINYRLGALGFLAHPALADEHGASGNYGTLDQIAALRWVRDNIRAFGGDPERVMIFGESAGGLSVCLLLASPLARGLFHAALVESGGCTVATQATRYEQGLATAERLGCDDAACLRARDAADFLADPPRRSEPTRLWEMMHGPNIDGHVFIEDPLVTLREGRHAKVPLVVGSNADEFELFTPAFATCAGYYGYLAAIFGDRTDEVTAQYPCLGFGTPRDAAVAAMTDHMFTCEARRIARAAVAGGSPAVWRYWFTRTFTGGHPLGALDAFHTAELPFVFQTFDVVDYTPNTDDRALADAIGAAWARLATSGEPGAPWPAYDPARDTALVLDMPLAPTEQVRAARCDFWDDFMAR
jgi:para-nitrobenzyl esterase